MPSIIINNSCNLNCSYCFEEHTGIKEIFNNISLENFQNILDWCAPAHIGIVGGEPTLHPQFSNILKKLEDYNRRYCVDTILYTNGILLYKYIDFLFQNLNMLININNPKNLSLRQKKDLAKSLEALNNKFNLSRDDLRITFGCNLYSACEDYSWFWDVIDKYYIKIIRVSVTTPLNEQYIYDRNSYFILMKDRLINFVKEAYDRQVKILFDCSQIPFCYFSYEEINLIQRVAINNFYQSQADCLKIVSITQDFKADLCFGIKDFQNPIECSDFFSYNEMYNYICCQNMSLFKTNNSFSKCQNCILDDSCCIRGCLGYKDKTKET